MLTTRPLVLAVALAPLATGCDVRVGDHGVSVAIVEGRASDEWTRSYTLPAGAELEIVNANGQIEVFPAAGPQVEVRATRDVRSRNDETAQALLAQVAIAETVGAERVHIESPPPPANGRFQQRMTVTFRVNIPEGLAVALRNQNGSVRLENVSGRLDVSTSNGMISGRGVSGALDASTVNGGVVVDMVEVTGDMRLSTVNGGVRLDVRPGLNATLEASAVNGAVVVRDDVRFEPTVRERARVVGRINEGGPRIVVQTTNGAVVVGEGRGPGGAPEVAEPELRER